MSRREVDTESSIHFLRRILGDDMRSVEERLRGPAKRYPPRKRIREKACPDDCCMPGLSGQCVACADES
jgi:hypothetical protein